MGGLPVVGISRTDLCAALVASAVALAIASTAAPRAGARAGGTIAGVVTTKETAPRPIRVTIDPGVCGDSLPDESVTVDGAGHLANAVISIAAVKAASPAEVTVANEKCRFVSHVSLVKPGGAVKMISHDATIHTMHAAGADARALFNLSLPMPNVTLSRPVDRPGVVTLTCSTHTWMRGYLHVTDSLSAVSGADGAFTLANVPAGTHELRVWHEALKAAAPLKVTVKDGETTKIDVRMVK
jgi:plastocyanin